MLAGKCSSIYFSEKMTLEEAENVLVKEFKKPTKLRDSALIARTQRDTLKQRRLFIEKKHGGSVEHLMKKGFHFLEKSCISKYLKFVSLFNELSFFTIFTVIMQFTLIDSIGAGKKYRFFDS